MRWICSLLIVVSLAGCAQRNPRDPHREAYWTWMERNRVTDVSLRGLSVVDRRVAWASGQNGTVLRTVNGGRDWSRMVVPGAEGLDLRDVEAFDADSAIVMSAGSPAHLYRTTDGGTRWQRVYENPDPDVFLDCIAFHGDRGLAFGDPLDGTFVLESMDRGRTWQRVPPAELPAMADGEAGFAASGSNIAFTSDGMPMIVTGGTGGTRALVEQPSGGWNAVDLPLAKGGQGRGAFSVAIDPTGRAIAVGGDYLEPKQRIGTAVWSEDDGRTWHASEAPPYGYRSCVAVCSRETFWSNSSAAPVLVAVGTNGCDVSWDGGRTWKRISETGYHAIAFAPGTGVGYAVGADGRVAEVLLQ